MTAFQDMFVGSGFSPCGSLCSATVEKVAKLLFCSFVAAATKKHSICRASIGHNSGPDLVKSIGKHFSKYHYLNSVSNLSIF